MVHIALSTLSFFSRKARKKITALIPLLSKVMPLFKEAVFPFVLLFVFFISIAEGSLNWNRLLLVSLVIIEYKAFKNYDKILSKILPFERLSKKKDPSNTIKFSIEYKWKKILLKLLDPNHLVALWSLTLIGQFMDLWLAWIFLLLINALYLPYSSELAKSLIFNNQIKKQSLKSLQKFAPKIALHLGGTADTAYQVNQWIPVLERLNTHLVIILRDRPIASRIDNTSIPIFYARRLIDIETLIGTGINTVLYPGNGMKNGQMLRFTQIQHLFINHGESDKSVNQSQMLMAYDKLLIAGPMAEKRLRQSKLPLRNGQIIQVGRPQNELLLSTQNSTNKPIKKVLYAPTWEGFTESENYSSLLTLGYSIAQEFAHLECYELIIKPHPYTGRRSNQYKKALKKLITLSKENKNLKIIDSIEPISQAMNQSDLMITDLSSILSDYLYTQKPIVLCVKDQWDKEALGNQFPTTRAAYLLHKADHINQLLNAIKSKDSLMEQRAKVCKEALGDFNESSMQRFSRVINECIRNEI